MATGFSFKVQGLDQLIRLFKQLPPKVQKELGTELEITAGEIRDGAKKDAPVDEARVRNSISIKKHSVTEFTVVAQSSYAGYLEFGTKTKVSVPAGLEDVASDLKGPGEGTANPLDALQGWVKRKGLAGTYSVKTRRRKGNKQTKEKQDRQLAFVIWRHIKKFGIKPHPYFFKQMEPAANSLVGKIKAIIQDII
jgi:HK97 gp10 family phage protein